MEDLTLVAVVVVALFFDFTNGFHDTANSIATSVSTRALTPRTAVDPGGDPQLRRRVRVVRGRGDDRDGDRRTRTRSRSASSSRGSSARSRGTSITWFLGLPSSSSHALIGGVAGSAIAASGLDVINWDGIWDKVVMPGVLVAPRSGSPSRSR